MKRENPKIKHSALSNSCEDDGLKDVDVFAKVISLQCSWTKRLQNLEILKLI